MIKLGVIGTSAIAEKCMTSVLITKEFEIAAIYSRTREKGESFAEKYGNVPVYTDLEEMAKSGIEAIYIASPNSCHYAQSKLFLEHNIHVLCEKPVTCCLSEYEELKALADKNGVIYMEAIMSMYAASYDILHSAIKEIGNISYARLDFGQRSSRLDDFYKGIHQNIFDMSLHAGTLNDLGIYCVYAAVDLFGMPKEISAKANYFENGCDKFGVARFEYEDFTAVLTYCKNGQSAVHSEIVGDMGTVGIESVSQYAGIKLCKNGEETKLYPFPERSVIMPGEIYAFAAFIKGEKLDDYDNKSQLCRSVHRCMDMIKESANIKYE